MKQPNALTPLGIALAALMGLAWQQTLHAQSTATGQPRGAASPSSAPPSSTYTTQKTISGLHPPTNPLATDPTVGNAPSHGAPGNRSGSGPTASKSASPADPPASVPRSPISKASAASAPHTVGKQAAK